MAPPLLDDNDMKLETVQRFSGIYLMVEETPGKPQLGERPKAVSPVITTNEVPQLLMRSAWSQSKKKKEGMEKGWLGGKGL